MKIIVVLLCIICLVAADGSSNQPVDPDPKPTTIQEIAKEKMRELLLLRLRRQILRPRNIPLNITVHIQNTGDVDGHDNQWVGTKEKSLRLEGFSIIPYRVSEDFQLEYFAHLENIGDTKWVKQGDFVGTRGQSRRLEGFGIRVTGENIKNYNVYYSAHLQDKGDTAEFKNGEFCGTRGESRRVEAIFVRLEKSGF